MPLTLKTGSLAPEHLDLLLQHLPLDITFVDAQDKVAYYNASPCRVTPRKPEDIGRDVRSCHSEKSLGMVEEILAAFKSGEQNSAEFWLEFKGKFLYTRYLAVRDNSGQYTGCLEVNEECSNVRGLEGQRRTLVWG